MDPFPRIGPDLPEGEKRNEATTFPQTVPTPRLDLVVRAEQNPRISEIRETYISFQGEYL